jgi:D-alanyl-D-alanine carboxypeptidase (penicillin-binding protein 5/6)
MPLPHLLRALAVTLGFSLPLAAQSPAPLDSRAANLLVLDYNSGQILAERNADVPLPPASMSKLVTLTLLFEALVDGRLQMDTTWTVSQRAHRMGGSRMFLETRDRPTTEDLIRGVAILSGNDATVAIAEGLAGSEEAFAQIATQRMRQIGLTQTTIANASGWPDPNHRMSLRDLSVLARHILDNYPQFYPYLAEREFTWNGITQANRVPLLGAGVGLDGLKTGHTSEAGYALTGSAVQGDRRIIFVFSGLESERARVEEAERIINWSFRQFNTRRIAAAGQTMALADVWLGSSRQVPLVPAGDVSVLVPVLGAEVSARVEHDGPIHAPIAQGQVLGRLVVTVAGLRDVEVPLVAGADVAEGGLLTRFRTAGVVLMNRLGVGLP